MKRVFFSCSLWVLCLTAPVIGRAENPWGALDEFVDSKNVRYAMDALVSHQPILYMVSENVTPKQKDIFVESIKQWPQAVLKIIKSANREKEFKDILPILQTPMDIVETKRSPDVLFTVLTETDNNACEGDGGCFSEGNGAEPAEINIIPSKKFGFSHTVLHEVGHYFGLSDQYEDARKNSHSNYSSDVNQKQGSIMDRANDITCDDADGFINLIDLRIARLNKGKFSKRARKGWRTLCPNNYNFYRKANTINRKRADFLRTNNPDFMELRSYHKGKIKQESLIELPDPAGLFDIGTDRNPNIVERDPKTKLITSIKTPLTTYTAAQTVQEDGAKSIFYNPKPEKVFWTRTFTYLPSERQADGKIFVPVIVTEYIDNIQTEKRNIRLIEDGDLKGSSPISIYAGRYNCATKSPNRTVRIILENKKVVSFKIYNTASESERYGLSGTAEDSSMVATIAGKKVPCTPDSFTNGICQEVFDYWTSYKTHVRTIKSLYKNFYDPLFDISGTQAQQIQRKAQQILTRNFAEETKTGKTSQKSSGKKSPKRQTK